MPVNTNMDQQITVHVQYRLDNKLNLSALIVIIYALVLKLLRGINNNKTFCFSAAAGQRTPTYSSSVNLETKVH